MAGFDFVPIDGDELTLDAALKLVDPASDPAEGSESGSHHLYFEKTRPTDFGGLTLPSYGGVGDKYCSVTSDGLSATNSSGSNARAEIRLPVIQEYSFSLTMPNNPGATGHFFYIRRGTEYCTVPDSLRSLKEGTYNVDVSGYEAGGNPRALISVGGGNATLLTAPAGSGPVFFGVALYHQGTAKLVHAKVAAGA